MFDVVIPWWLASVGIVPGAILAGSVDRLEAKRPESRRLLRKAMLFGALAMPLCIPFEWVLARINEAGVMPNAYAKALFEATGMIGLPMNRAAFFLLRVALLVAFGACSRGSALDREMFVHTFNQSAKGKCTASLSNAEESEVTFDCSGASLAKAKDVFGGSAMCSGFLSAGFTKADVIASDGRASADLAAKSCDFK